MNDPGKATLWWSGGLRGTGAEARSQKARKRSEQVLLIPGKRHFGGLEVGKQRGAGAEGKEEE